MSSKVAPQPPMTQSGRAALARAGIEPDPLTIEAQAYAFRQLVAHLRSVSDEASNIDVMNASGMCRNCVAKWYHRGLAYAGATGAPASYDAALEAVYGEPYGDWKGKHQRKATPEQLAKFEATKPWHAKHPPVETVAPKATAEPCCYEDECQTSPVPAPRPPPPPEGPVFRLGVLTVSDRASRGEYADLTGPAVETALKGYCEDVERRVVPDDVDTISDALRELCATRTLVLTAGGTGFGPRDVTPEATRQVLEKEAPGLIDLVHADALRRGADLESLLSRAAAGVRGSAVVVNLPGRPDAAARNAKVLLPTLVRAVGLNQAAGLPAVGVV